MPNSGRGNGIFFKRTYASIPQLLGLLYLVSLTLWQATVTPHLHQGLLGTHRKVWLSLLWGPCFWVLVSSRFCMCSPRVCFQVLWKFYDQILAFKVKFPGGFQSMCWIPRLGNLLWVLELPQQCENVFEIIALHFVDRLLSGFMMGLMNLL